MAAGFQATGRTLKNLDFGSNTGDYFRKNIQARWFAYWLKGKGPLNLPRIQLFETGSNEWKAYDQWPPSGRSGAPAVPACVRRSVLRAAG